MNRSDLQKMMNLCRSDADLELPEFAPLAELVGRDAAVRRSWEKLQQMDDSIRQVIRDVPVPDGLEGRLLEALLPTNKLEPQPADSARSDSTTVGLSKAALATVASSGEGSIASSADDLPASDQLGDISTVPIDRTRQSRSGKWKVWSAALAGIAALVFVSLVLWPTREPVLVTQEHARERVQQWMNQLDQSAWQTPPGPQNLPLPAQLSTRPLRWQPVSATGSLGIVCYDMTSREPKAMLFVVRTKQKTEFAAQPPARLYNANQKWSVAAWTSNSGQGKFVYLLAVSGGERQYQSLIGRRNDLARTVHRSRSGAQRTG